MTIRFFGEVDRQGKKKTGEIRSEYPCWYHPARIDELKESVDKDERLISSGAIDSLPNTNEFKAELGRKKLLLEQIASDKPILTGKHLDRTANVYVHLTSQIADLMPSRSDMEKGLANPHDEVRKQSEPCINIDGFVDIVRECGVPLEKGSRMITRNQAARVWKITGKALGEATNVEYLRRDVNTGSYRTTRSLDQIIRDDG